MHLNEIESSGKKSGLYNAIIETPKGSQNKFSYNAGHHLMELKTTLPCGSSFPFDFGFIPSTLGEDGDPIDVMILMDAPAFTGCLVEVRLIGILEATQSEGKKTVRNDRLIAVADASRVHTSIKSIKDIDAQLLKEIEHFFISYNQMKGKVFTCKGMHSPKSAIKNLKQAQKRYKSNKLA